MDKDGLMPDFMVLEGSFSSGIHESSRTGEIFPCNICGAEYKHLALQKACRGIELEKLVDVPIGSVFVCGDSMSYGLLYKVDLEQQTHKRRYHLLRAAGGAAYGMLFTVPGVLVNAEFMAYAKGISDEEFASFKKQLEERISWAVRQPILTQEAREFLRSYCGGPGLPSCGIQPFKER